jgi:hypothetical protein
MAARDRSRSAPRDTMAELRRMDEMTARAEQRGREQALSELAAVKAAAMALAASSFHGSFEDDCAFWTRELREANERARVERAEQRAQFEAELLQVRESSAAALERLRDSSAAELTLVREASAAELARVLAASKTELEMAAADTLAVEARYVNFIRSVCSASGPTVAAMQHALSLRLSYWGSYTGTLPVNALICMGADVFAPSDILRCLSPEEN